MAAWSRGVSTTHPANSSVYTATKAAVTGVLAKELGPRKIRVNSINPGLIETEGVRSEGFNEGDFRKRVESTSPLERIGQTDDIAPTAVYLASDDSNYLTGEQIRVAGSLYFRLFLLAFELSRRLFFRTAGTTSFDQVPPANLRGPFSLSAAFLPLSIEAVQPISAVHILRREEMRKLMIAGALLAIWAAVPGSVKAQENKGFEVSGNYQFFRFNPGNGADGINCQGGAGSAAAYLTSRLGVVGEFAGCKATGLPSGVSAHQMSYLFGPRMYFPTTHGRIFPYAQALFGGDRLSSSISGLGSVSDNAFAMAIGGGADITLSKHVSLRAAQFDYFYTHFGGEGQNHFRIQSGIVYRFGR